MTTENNINQLAQRVSYNKADIERDASSEMLAPGAIVKIVIDKVEYKTEPTKGKGPGEDFVQMATCYVLDPRDEQSRLKRFRLNIRNTMPLKHPDYVDTHVPPDWANGLWSQFVQGFVPERCKSIEYKDGMKYFDGKKVDPEDMAEIDLGRADARLTEAVELLKTEGKDLLRRTCYATIKHSPAKDGSGNVFVNADKLRTNLGATEKLTAYDDLVVKIIPGQATGEAKPNGTNGHAGAAKTAVTGRSTRRGRS